MEEEKEEAKSVPLNKEGIEMSRRIAALAGLTPGVDGFEKVGEYCMKLAGDNEFMERAFMQIQSKEDLERLMAAELRKRFREVEVKEDNNHVSSGRSGDDHKRQELEQTSEATGNNQIEFKKAVSRAFDKIRAYGLECTVDRICEATRKQFGSLCSLKKEDREYIALEVNKKTAVGELKDIVTQVLEACSRENKP